MWYTILLKCALTHYDTFYYYIMQAFFCQGRFFIFVGMPPKHGLFRFFFVNLHKPDGTAADSKGNTAQSPPDGFARNLCADFPSYCPEIPCHTAVCLRNFYAICRKIWLRILRTSFIQCFLKAAPTLERHFRQLPL